jgi:competence protein ComFB
VLASPEQQEDTKKALLMGVDDVLLTPLQEEISKQRIHNMLDLSENRMIHNVMEDLVRLEIDENIDTLGICPCPICRRDLMTLTLNNVSPKYVSTEKGAIMSKVGGNSRVERIKLLAEIAHYAQMVKERPRHS